VLWLALHLPRLSLEAFCATLPAVDAVRPVALVGEHQVIAANPAAAQRGIKPGLKRATALALSADLLLGQANELRDAAALQAVAHAALAFTPMVTLTPDHPATVLLEVQASLRYFGGLPKLLARLRQALAPLRHRAHIASAPTPLGAALLAEWQGGFEQGAHSTDLGALQQLLDGAPVWLLGPGREHWEALQGMGLQTLSDLRHLPRTGLARRFGEGLLADLDAAFGRRPDPREALLPPPVFESTLELFARADTSAQVLHGAALLLARLVAWAQAQQARISAFTLQMQHEPRHRGDAAEATTLRIELAEPSVDPGHLQLLLRERLARVELLAPTLDLRLSCQDIVHAEAPNGELFPNRQSQALGLTRLLERLRARLGEEQVLRIVPVADHRPERACGLQPVSAPAGAPPKMPLPDRLPLHRPVWLLPEPVPLASRDRQPLLQGRVLQLLSGPERIESGWWDGGLVTRDYFIAADAEGALLWIFCDRLTAAATGWFLQGRFG
jgi:protein ImuB